jgi:hypothetical protein
MDKIWFDNLEELDVAPYKGEDGIEVELSYCDTEVLGKLYISYN